MNTDQSRQADRATEGLVATLPENGKVEDALPPKGQLPIRLISGVLGLVVLAGVVVYVASQREASDEWKATRVSGMSITLPATFEVSTDPDDAVEAMATVGDPSADELAEMIRQFPDFFVLAGVEPIPNEAEIKTTLMVLRLPSGGGSLDELADGYVQGVEEAFEVTARENVTVGSSGYRAVRIDYEGSLGGQPDLRGTDYVVEGGAQVWILSFATLPEQADRLSQVFDRSIASLTLP